MESSTQIYFSKENCTVVRKAKAGLKNNKREFGKELQNVDRTPVAVEPSMAEAQEPAVSPLKLSFSSESSDRDSVLAYQTHIFDHLKARQANYKLGKDFLAAQKDVTSKMRSILVDWLVEVSYKFKLLPQTLFQAVNIVDRYLAVQQVDKNELQLVGITALFIVAKYEEVYPPQIDAFVATCDNAYTKEQILDTEADMLSELNFDLTQSSSLYFLQMMQLQFKLEEKPLAFARYVLETALLESAAARHSNLALAASAVFLVLKIFKLGSWTAEHGKTFGVSEAEIKVCAKDLYMIMQKMDASSLCAVKIKYASAECFEVSKFKIEKTNGSRQ